MNTAGHPQTVLYVALPTPVGDGFDYLPAEPAALPRPGCRVKVPFGRKQQVGVVIEVRAHSDVPSAKLRHVLDVLDEEPVLNAELLELAGWVSRYYHHALGEVIHAMLPAALRRGRPPAPPAPVRWKPTPAAADEAPVKKAPKQAALLHALQQSGDGLSGEQLDAAFENWRGVMRALEKKGLARREQQASPMPDQPGAASETPVLNQEQREAVEQVSADFDRFRPWLLEGVTGSGKTEVYLQLIERCLARDRQVLILVPEIGLTPQLLERFRSRLDRPVLALHSGLSDQERHHAWHAGSTARASIVIGTRSAVFLPLPDLGLIVVDEEHDGSLKQQEGLRYHARDLAVIRARYHRIPVLLGSATPSLESLHNAREGRYGHLRLSQRAGGAAMPRIGLVDARPTPAEQPVSTPLLQAMRRHLEEGAQVLIFLNRRGYAPVLLCTGCGWKAECPRCDVHMTLHQHDRRLLCHHCGGERAPPERCPECGEDGLQTVGKGTEQLEQCLRQQFPDHNLVRIDRDSTRRKGSLEAGLERVHSGEARILVGTQMLAKGHHFPDVTLVGILGIDQALFSADFRGPEYMAQLVIQVAGRAGRADRPGQVLIETRHPDNALLRLLIAGGFEPFAEAALTERRSAALPPFTHLALIRAEAVAAEAAMTYLRKLADGVVRPAGDEAVEVLGPVPAPMERRAGRYRAQLLLQSNRRGPLHRVAGELRRYAARLPERRKVRWSIDIDPMEML